MANTFFTQKIYLQSGYTKIKFWIAGNGVSAFTVSSAVLTQGTKSVAVKCLSKTSFSVPASGRWTDLVSLSGFTTPGEVSFTVQTWQEISVVDMNSSNTTIDDEVVFDSSGVVSKVSVDTNVVVGEILFDLEFEGTFADSVNGLTPTQEQNVELEASTRIFGNGCLKIVGSADYSILQYTATDDLKAKMASNGWTISGFSGVNGISNHSAVAYEKVSGGYNIYAFNNGVLDQTYFIADSVVNDYILLSLTLIDIVVGEGFDFYVDSYQIISGALWTADFTPPTAPLTAESIVAITTKETNGSILSVTSDGTITFSGNPSNGDTLVLTLGGKTYTFTYVSVPTGASDEIVIGSTLDITIANTVSAINAIDGALFYASASDNIITITAYSDDDFLISTTSSSITLGSITKTITGEGNGTLAPLEVSGVAKDHALFGGNYGLAYLPKLSATGNATASGNNGSVMLGAMTAYGVSKNYVAQANSSSTDAEIIALLDLNDAWILWLISLIFAGGSNDDIAIEITRWVADNITYHSDNPNSDTWNDAKRTLNDGYGDCEDGAILIASLLLNMGVLASNVRVYFGTTNGIGHAWAMYRRSSDNQWITLDWTSGSAYWDAINSVNELTALYPSILNIVENNLDTTDFAYGSAYEYLTSTSVVTTSTELAYAESLYEPTFAAELVAILPLIGFSAHTGSLLDVSLPLIDFSAHAYTDVIGKLKAYLPRINFTGRLIQGINGSLNVRIPRITFSGNIIVSRVSSLSATLPVVEFIAHGVVGKRCSLDVILPTLAFRAHAYWTGYNSLDVNIPLVEFHAHAKGNVLGICFNTKNSAITEYDHYDYNSLFTTPDGKTYGAKSDGIYLLSGDTDNGTSIPWRIKTGKFDLEDSFLKKARYVWLSYRPSGDLVLIVDDGSKEYEYPVESFQQIDNAVRVKIGKGIRNRYIQLELKNTSDEKMFLDHIRLFAEPIKEHKR
ncbi:MAG: hypothetical protein LLG40_13350 [Deltaproteobacteria bacterium]|nr:hypothetical protein [Deltaproteobacteria bacterium]